MAGISHIVTAMAVRHDDLVMLYLVNIVLYVVNKCPVAGAFVFL